LDKSINNFYNGQGNIVLLFGGSPEILHSACGYDTKGIIKAVEEILERDYILK